MNEMSESWTAGYAAGKRLSGNYPVTFNAVGDTDLDLKEFVAGLRFAGYHGEVRFLV